MWQACGVNSVSGALISSKLKSVHSQTPHLSALSASFSITVSPHLSQIHRLVRRSGPTWQGDTLLSRNTVFFFPKNSDTDAKSGGEITWMTLSPVLPNSFDSNILMQIWKETFTALSKHTSSLFESLKNGGGDASDAAD